MNEKEKQEYIAYLQSRKSSSRHNYYKESLKVIEHWKKDHPDQQPRIILHACCIVCACWPLDFLKENGFDVTVFFSNSNIWPKSEYDHRLNEVKRYLHERWNDDISLIVSSYDYEKYAEIVIPERENDPEGWKSCFACYAKRIDEAFAYGDANGYDFCTTVMTFSRQKDSEKINEIGLRLAAKYSRTKWFVSDFKKADGQKKSEAICDAYDIYRQDYCGCKTSYYERHPEKISE